MNGLKRFLTLTMVLSLIFISNLPLQNYFYTTRRVHTQNNIMEDESILNEAILIDVLCSGEQGSIIIDNETNEHISRLSLSGERILRSDSLLTNGQILEGLSTGKYKVVSHQSLIDQALENRESSGIGITGGGDCAGIGSFLSALYANLPQGFTMLGIKNAGEGLSVSPEEFRERLILIDSLIANDISSQSSTPLGSSRVEPFNASEVNTMANLSGWGFFYGTGGNDHLGLLEKISNKFPEMVVVGTFKSIDGDGTINNRPAQMLGFSSAAGEYQKMIYSAAQNALTHNQIHVIETMGRGSGNLPYYAARRFPDNFNQLSAEEQRKIEDCRSSIMILVPERSENSAVNINTTLRSIAQEAMRIKKQEGNVVVVVAEGFMPPEMRAEMRRLASDEQLKEDWVNGRLTVNSIADLIEVLDENDPRLQLQQMLRDNLELAAKFAKITWESEIDPHGNIVKLAGIRDFIIQAIHTIGGAEKVNELICCYEGRGASPNPYDIEMGTRAGKVAASVIRDGITGGRAVIYFDLASDGPTNPLEEFPAIVALVGVSANNDLNNTELHSDFELRRNGVFWNIEDLSRYFVGN
ncbi:MAG: 6-phosphofructokinase [Candidatus Saelkia tenebricola]|nr:6-phosphofructokinase [Candidatus Saelkia tenebricola]